MKLCEITKAGFQRARLDQIVADLEMKMRGIFGEDIDLSPETPDGQWIGAQAEMFSDLAQVAEQVYNARSPSGSTEAALARFVRLNGIVKKGERRTVATATLGGTAGTAIPAGSLVAKATDDRVVFRTTEAVEIGVGGTVDAPVEATEVGPLTCPAGGLSKIVTVISGWETCTNAADAVPGAYAETDAALRVRRTRSVAAPAQSVLDAIWSGVTEIDTVAHVAVYENSTDATIVLKGGATLARKSIQVIVDGGSDIAIAEAMWARVAPGPSLVGANSHAVVDVQGFEQTMRWDSAVALNIYVSVKVSQALGSVLIEDIKQAVVSWGNENSEIGADVPWFGVCGAIATRVPAVSGMIVSVKVGTSPSPSGMTPIAVAHNQIPRWDPSRVTVTT